MLVQIGSSVLSPALLLLSCYTLSILGPLPLLVGPLSILEFQGPLILDLLLYRLGVCVLILDAETG